MFLIVLLSSITILIRASDPKEVFINLDDAYFNTNSKINIEAGKNLSISCASTVEQSSKVDYKWYLSSTPYTAQTNNRKLMSSEKDFTTTANSTLSGYYMCLISTVEGYKLYTPVIQVVVEYFDITAPDSATDTTIELNSKVTVLQCSGLSINPTPIISWKKDGVDVSKLNLNANIMHVTGKIIDKIYSTKVNDLIILNYKSAYEGQYTCEAQSTGSLITNKKVVAKKYQVKTAAAVRQMTDNSTKIIFTDNGGTPSVGDTITLRCGASGYPTPTYAWYDTDDTLLQSSNRFEVLETSLIVMNLQKSDNNMEYKCGASSGDSLYMESIRLSIADPAPEFSSVSKNSEYNVPGADITLDFGEKVEGNNAYLWNGQNMANFPEGAGDIGLESNGILKINGMQKNGSGVIQCILYNANGMVTQFRTVIIRDAQPAQVKHTTVSSDDITVDGNNIHSVRGANFTMQCEGSGNPTPSDISIAEPVTTSQTTSKFVKVNRDGKYIGQLLIESVDEAYIGSYNCCTHNYVLGTKKDACVTINLAVEEKVKVTQDTEDNNYSLVAGKQVYGTKNYALSARCKATGLPRPTISIKRINSCGTVSTITQSNDIEIIQVDYNDTSCLSDSFECCGKNTIKGVEHTECYGNITVSFVDQEGPNTVALTNFGSYAATDASYISSTEFLALNCSSHSFPESSFTWQYKNTASNGEYKDIDSTNFQTSVTKSKGFTYSLLTTQMLAGSFFTGTEYAFMCTAKNAFGEAVKVLNTKIITEAPQAVSSGVYLAVGLILFIAALVIIFVMYIFFLISSGKKKKGELGMVRHMVCNCCEPKEELVESCPDQFDYKLLTLEKLATNSFHVPLYSHPRLVTVDDEFSRAPVYRELEQMTLKTNQMSKYEHNLF